jgi:phosphomannomutase
MIKFGTDGWRGVIADDFTFRNVELAAQAAADYIKNQGREREGLAIGYDRRFLSREFAEIIASVSAGNGIKTILSGESLSTPALSYGVINNKTSGGVIVTASHNPPKFNGIKFKCDFGGSAPSEVTSQIESYLEKSEIRKVSLEEGKKKGLIREKDLTSPYLKNLESYLDLKVIRKGNLRVVYDAMFGVGAGYLEKVLRGTGIEIIPLHQELNPLFGGINPEPIEENLGPLIDEVKRTKSDLGLAVDGDADRVGIVDDQGKYLSPLEIFPLLLLYLIEERKWRGGVAQTISLGYLSERIAREYNLPLYKTPVGFKYINKLMREKEIILGGEESGGYGYHKYIPERDGLLSSLLFVEMVLKKKKKLSEILSALKERFGKSSFKRVDLKLKKPLDKEKFVKELKARAPQDLLGVPIKEIKTLDGIKFVLEDDSWLLLRPSGTEPKLRIYSEAPEEEKTEALIREGEKFLRR